MPDDSVRSAEPLVLVEAVTRLTRLLADAVDVDAQLRSALEIAIEAIDCESGTIMLHDPVKRNLMFCHVVGSCKAGRSVPVNLGLVGTTIRDDEGIAGQVFQSGEAKIVNDAGENPQHSKRLDEDTYFETRNLATVPICFPGGIAVGVLQLVNKDPSFGEKDLGTLSALASIVALSIVLARSRQQDEV